MALFVEENPEGHSSVVEIVAVKVSRRRVPLTQNSKTKNYP